MKNLLKIIHHKKKLILDLVSNKSNQLGSKPDIHGNYWYGKIVEKGRQLWASIRGDIIQNGGLNKDPKPYNVKTGLSRVKVPK